MVRGSSANTTALQYWYRIPTGGNSDQEDTHALQCGLQCMGNGGGDQAPGRDCHNFGIGIRMAG